VAVVIGDIVRLDAEFVFDAATIMQNVFHFKVTRNDTATDALFMVEARAELDAWYQIINVDVSTLVSYNIISGLNITKKELLPAGGWPVLVAGANAGEALATQLAAMVFHRTTRPKTRAAKFLPPLTEAGASAGGVIAPAVLTRLGTFAGALTGGITQTNVDADYGAWNGPLSRFTPVTAGFVPNRFRTQRRRRVGVGI
jgi:hypothetical protein